MGSLRFTPMSYPECNIQGSSLVDLTEENAHEILAREGWVYQSRLKMGSPIIV